MPVRVFRGIGNALFGRGGSPGSLRSEQGENQARELETILMRLQGLADAEGDRSRATTDELYGTELDQQERSGQATAAGIRSSLARASMAGGGDAGGSTTADMLQTGQDANQALSDFRTRISQLARRDRQQARNNQVGILSSVASGRGSLMNREDQLAALQQQLRQQRRQANQQLFGDVIGAITNVASGG